MINFKIILRVVGLVLIVLGVFMGLPLAWSVYTGEGDTNGFIYSLIVCFATGCLLFCIKPDHFRIGKREGYLIVSLGWLVLCLAGTLPYLFTGQVSTLSDAFFESTSGLTTTGATIFKDIEILPQGILLWRSLTQWIGGMGIIVLTVAIFPLIGVSGVELFVAEAPGPVSEKIHPRIKETAKRLWGIYLGLTLLLCAILFWISKMSFFDALNHALTTMSTGGFSTKNASIAHFDAPVYHYPIILFMFLAGMNYTVIYFTLKGTFSKVWASDEFKAYLLSVSILVVGVTLGVHFSTNHSFEQSFRQAAFQVISVVTTTGFITADYTSWNNGLTLLFFFLLFTGACAGSTSGGIKVIRHLVFFKNTLLEFKRLLHPRAVIRVKIDKTLVQNRVITHILVFLMVYLLIFFAGTITMSFILTDDQPLLTALGTVATCLGNVGPGIGSVGPVDNFADIPLAGKNILCLLMIIGRLELFTTLIIFTPYFWKTN